MQPSEAFMSSGEIDKIAPAMVAAQKAMNAAVKSATNPHFKSKYSDLATVIDAVKGPLNDAGIAFLQTITNDTTGVMVTTTLLHESGQWIAERQYLPVPQQTPQAFGSGITYAKRYGLQSICGLPSEDDDGQRASEPEKENAHRVPDPTRPNTAIQTATDAWDLLSAADQKLCTDLAIAVTDMVENKEALKAHDYIEAQGLSLEQRMGIWHVLKPRSDIRTALQKAARTLKAPNLKAPELASQP